MDNTGLDLCVYYKFAMIFILLSIFVTDGKYACMQTDCNIPACGFDGLECTFGMQPWQNCTQQVQEISCWQLFKNGICEAQCNTQQCLYDGFDCLVCSFVILKKMDPGSYIMYEHFKKHE